MGIESPFDEPTIPQQPKENLFYDELREKLRDPSYLPTHEEISRAFPPEKASPRAWFDLCFDEDHPIFEFLNAEYVSALSDYLSQRAEMLGASKDSPVTILEIGAGDGRLSYFLKQMLESKLPGKVRVIATDSGEWGIKTAFPVESIDHREALKKYQPSMVVFSWIPYHEDVTDDFRAAKSVDEYILVGDVEVCGDPWKTWGRSEDSATPHEGGEHVAPYIADGFECEDLQDIGAHQICRMDSHDEYHHSSTVSFRRKK